MRIKYIIKYHKGQKPKQVTGFLRIPKDMPENSTSEQLLKWVCEKHNLDPGWGLDVRFKNFTSKNFEYEKKSLAEIQGSAAKKATGNRN